MKKSLLPKKELTNSDLTSSHLSFLSVRNLPFSLIQLMFG